MGPRSQLCFLATAVTAAAPKSVVAKAAAIKEVNPNGQQVGAKFSDQTKRQWGAG